MKHFCIILTQEGKIRFGFLKKEHGLLFDHKEKKGYAIVREAKPTNWPGRWSRAYLVHEENAQTVQIGAPERSEARTVQGATVEVQQPLCMVAKVKLATRRGEDGREREIELTPESIFDRTMSVQVRRLGNRRIQWFHALLFVTLGMAIALTLIAAITLFSAGKSGPEMDEGGLQVNNNPTGGVPQSGPVGMTPTIQVQTGAVKGSSRVGHSERIRRSQRIQEMTRR